MIEAILTVLPVLVKWVPALAKVIETAVGGDSHPDEGAWCSHVPGLEDVCAALRNKDGSTVAAVHKILGNIGTSTDPVTVAMDHLRSKGWR